MSPPIFKSTAIVPLPRDTGAALQSGGTWRQIDDERIGALRTASAVAGDREQVALCDRALAGDDAARAECERVIRDAAAELAADGEVVS